MVCRWDKHGYGLKLVERLDDAEDEDLYEEYIFIERRKYGMLFETDNIWPSMLIRTYR